MADYLLDTNHASWFMEIALGKLAQQPTTSNSRFGVSITVLAELYYAVYASQYRAQNLARLRRLLESLLLWPFDDSAAEKFGIIQAEQRAKGRPIPPMYAQIAAVARINGLILLTADRHFQYIERLPLENWLEPQ